MTPDHTAAAWEYIHDRLAIIEAHCKSTSTTFQKEVVEPFDKMLEKKADYYLKTEAEKGAAPEWLGKEIEVLARMREYVAVIEDHADQQLQAALYLYKMEIHRLVRHIADLESHIQSDFNQLNFAYEYILQLLDKCQSQKK